MCVHFNKYIWFVVYIKKFCVYVVDLNDASSTSFLYSVLLFRKLIMSDVRFM